jgi:hypothetical protein
MCSLSTQNPRFRRARQCNMLQVSFSPSHNVLLLNATRKSPDDHKSFCEEKNDMKIMYLHGLQITNIDNSSTEAVATLTAEGDIFLEDRNREFALKVFPHLVSEIRGHTVSQFSCTRDHLIALPGPPVSLSCYLFARFSNCITCSPRCLPSLNL